MKSGANEIEMYECLGCLEGVFEMDLRQGQTRNEGGSS